MKKQLRGIVPLAGIAIMVAAAAAPAFGQTTVPTRENMVSQLSGLEAAAEIDVAAWRQQALDRVKSKADAVPLKRPPVTTQLLKLPQFLVEVEFDADSPIIRPASYRTLGRIADALYDPALLPFSFLIVGHTESTGRREPNLILSHRRANAIRDALVNTFKISPKRIQAVGLGEEQLLDANRPSAPINQQVQVVTVGKAL
jgi:OmpA-OmpF porin, OOP family